MPVGPDVERENVTFFLLNKLVHFFGLKFWGNHPFDLRTCQDDRERTDLCARQGGKISDTRALPGTI